MEIIVDAGNRQGEQKKSNKNTAVDIYANSHAKTYAKAFTKTSAQTSAETSAPKYANTYTTACINKYANTYSRYGGENSGKTGKIRNIDDSAIIRRGSRIKPAEAAVQVIFTLCALLSILAVSAISFYILTAGIPALIKVGWKEILFETEWSPAAAEPNFGIAYMIITSITGTALAVLLAVPVGVLAAVFLVEISGPGAAGVIRTAVEVLAGIPSVIYGLLGVCLINPFMYRLERKLFAGLPAHQFTGGANLLSASLVLAVMILPTIINISEASIRRISPDIRAASFALGASQIQTIFRVVLPAAKPGIVTGVILGLGRALGEATAIMLVAGNSVNMPLPFHSVRFLTTTIVSEMGYSRGTHREMLFTVGLVLYAFILMLNIALNRSLKKSE